MTISENNDKEKIQQIVFSIDRELGGRFAGSFSNLSNLTAGNDCVYSLPLGVSRDNLPNPVTITAMGTIWSGQGLRLLSANPEKSVFDGCPLEFIAGFSCTTSSGFVYVADCTHKKRGFYFRGQLEFMGESRQKETVSEFNNMLDQWLKMKESEEEFELIGYNGQMILRKKVDGKYQNIVI